MIALTWDAGFFDDDSVISLWRHQADEKGSWIAYCTQNFTNFITYQGRIVPVFSFVILPLLLLIGDDITAYRIYFSVIYIVSFVLTYHGLRRALRNDRLAAWILIVFVANIQLQNYHDAYTSYFAYLPLATALIVCAVASFAALLPQDHGARPVPPWQAVRYLGWVAAAVLTWELAIVIAALNVVQLAVARADLKAKFRLLALPSFWAVGLVVANLILKHGSINTGTQLAVLSPAKIWDSYRVQFTGAFPLALHDPMAGMARLIERPSSTWLLFVGVFLAVIVFVVLAPKGTSDDSRTPAFTGLGLGLCLLVVPPALTAITPKYQNELRSGMAYLQVYAQSLGFALSVVGLWSWLSRSIRYAGALTGFAAASLVAIFGLHLSRNLGVVQIRNAYWQNPRDTAATLLAACRNSPRPGQIVVVREYLQRWENRDFSAQYLGKPADFKALPLASLGQAESDRLIIDYAQYLPPGRASIAYAGNLVGRTTPAMLADPVILVVGELAQSSGLMIEYGTVTAVVRVPVTPDQSTGKRIIVRPARPILAGSVRLISGP